MLRTTTCRPSYAQHHLWEWLCHSQGLCAEHTTGSFALRTFNLSFWPVGLLVQESPPTGWIARVKSWILCACLCVLCVLFFVSETVKQNGLLQTERKTHIPTSQ
jgi:hypothetical protein